LQELTSGYFVVNLSVETSLIENGNGQIGKDVVEQLQNALAEVAAEQTRVICLVQTLLTLETSLWAVMFALA